MIVSGTAASKSIKVGVSRAALTLPHELPPPSPPCIPPPLSTDAAGATAVTGALSALQRRLLPPAVLPAPAHSRSPCSCASPLPQAQLLQEQQQQQEAQAHSEDDDAFMAAPTPSPGPQHEEVVLELSPRTHTADKMAWVQLGQGRGRAAAGAGAGTGGRVDARAPAALGTRGTPVSGASWGSGGGGGGGGRASGVIEPPLSQKQQSAQQQQRQRQQPNMAQKEQQQQQQQWESGSGAGSGTDAGLPRPSLLSQGVGLAGSNNGPSFMGKASDARSFDHVDTFSTKTCCDKTWCLAKRALNDKDLLEPLQYRLLPAILQRTPHPAPCAAGVLND